MGIKSEDHRRAAHISRQLDKAIDDLRMPQMDTVKISDGNGASAQFGRKIRYVSNDSHTSYPRLR